MSTSAPPPASLSTQRTLRPWYLLLAMIFSWLIGVYGLSDSFAKVLFLRENNLPDLDAIIRGLSDEAEPVTALWYLYEASYMRALGDAAKIAFPLSVGKLILSVLLVITSAMAMSGRPGSRTVAIQAHLAFAALSGATFWLLRDARYAAIDVMVGVRELIPKLLASEPPRALETCMVVFSKPSLMLLARLSLAVFGIGALLVGVLALTTERTKAFFEAVAKATEEPEDL